MAYQCWGAAVCLLFLIVCYLYQLRRQYRFYSVLVATHHNVYPLTSISTSSYQTYFWPSRVWICSSAALAGPGLLASTDRTRGCHGWCLHMISYLSVVCDSYLKSFGPTDIPTSGSCNITCTACDVACSHSDSSNHPDLTGRTWSSWGRPMALSQISMTGFLSRSVCHQMLLLQIGWEDGIHL